VLRIFDDAALERRLSETARAGTVSRFARAPMVTRYEAYYDKVLSSSSSRP
jgi:hypothetical protein